MKKLIGIITVLMLVLNSPVLTLAKATVAGTSTSVQVKRLSGKDRYETAAKIADELALENGIDFSKGQKHNTVVLASGNDFPDAIAGAPLGQLYGGPILLVDRTPEASTTTLDYIRTHVNPSGRVFILGGSGVIPDSFIEDLESMGFHAGNIQRIGGKDRNETSLLIAKKLLNSSRSVFLVSDSNFYDALTIASYAVSVNIPILLISSSGLTPEQKSFCDSQIDVISVGDIQKTIALSYPKAIGFSGSNRYDTNAKWANNYLVNKPKVFLTTGEDYPDALAGALLAGTLDECPVIFTTPNSLRPETTWALNQISYYDKRDQIVNTDNQQVTIPAVMYPELVVLGGTGAVSDDVVKQAQQILNGSGNPSSETTTVNSSGNLAGNVDNDGLAATQGEWLYYTDLYYKGSIYKVRQDGTGKTKLTDDVPLYINVSGDWVYYKNFKDNKLYKIKTDGTGRTKLSDDNSDGIMLAGDWIYYINESDNFSIYKMKTDGTNKVKLNADYSWNINLVNNTIYYTKVYDDFKIYRMNIDGTGDSKVSDQAQAFNMVVAGDHIYYTNVTATDRFAIFTMKTDGTGISKVTSDHSRSFTIDNDWIYYANESDASYLYKIKTDGTNKTKLNNSITSYVNVTGDWVYYVNNPPSNSQLYKTKIDGSEDKPVE